MIQALQVLSGLMQEDDENVELWYLMAVAFNSLESPDYESARYVSFNDLLVCLWNVVCLV